jgi:two-component system, cell cycle sensor histidine kinase and response regulator CckA
MSDGLPFGRLLDAALDAVVITDTSSRIVAWNHSAESLFGWQREEMLGRGLSETIIPARHRAAHEAGVRRFLQTGVRRILDRRITIEALDSAERELPIELTVTTYVDDGVLYFVSFIRDLRVRRDQQATLEARYGVTRVLADARDANDAAERLLPAVGATLGWDVGAFWLIDADERLIHCRHYWQAEGVRADAFLERSCATPLRCGEGLPGRVWERAAPAWIDDVTHDPNFPRMPLAVEAGLHGAFGFPLVADGVVLGVIEFLTRSRPAPEQAQLDMFAALGSDIGQFLRRRQAEAALRESRAAAAAERERLIAELEQERASLEEANRIKADFLATMSHELRTPLNAITGYTELLALHIGSPEKLAAYPERIALSARHLLQLIEEILTFSRIEAGREALHIEDVALADLLDEVAAIIEPLAGEKGLRFAIDAADRSVVLHTDGRKVRQILLNLTGNAVKFTDEGGITFHSRVADNRIIFEVRDTGIGIAPEDVAKIWEPFCQVEPVNARRAGGTGLGLTVTRQLARLLGGDVEVDSTPGKGSTFCVTLPLESATAEPDEYAESNP